jgi:lipoprotein-anchoring transpeptidase ErfK/SrfK
MFNPSSRSIGARFAYFAAAFVLGQASLLGLWAASARAQTQLPDQTSDSLYSAATSSPPASGAEQIADNSVWVEASVHDLQQSSDQWIQIDLSEQRLTAWEGDTPVFSTEVSTGRISDSTPIGVYAVQEKYRTARMQGESQGKTYDIPDVPYTMYFSGSYAIHGAYWHDQFGDPVSSGCVNVPIEGAAWLFNWAGVGTSVVVQD